MKLFVRIFIGVLCVAVLGVSGGAYVYGQNADSTTSSDGTTTQHTDPIDTATDPRDPATDPDTTSTDQDDARDDNASATDTTTDPDPSATADDEPVSDPAFDPTITSNPLRPVGDRTDSVAQNTDTEEEEDLDPTITSNPLISDRAEDDGIDPVVTDEEEISQEEEEVVEEQRTRIKERDNITPELLDDSDGDGLTDFDEINIYGTDPNDPNTGGGPYEDGEDVRRGLDPLSAGVSAIVYEDPRVDRGEVSEKYTVDEIEVVETETGADGTEVVTAVEIRGTAQPKAFVTVYIFSNPVVVTVQADGDGKWSYLLEKRLEDGDHIAYAAAVNNSGKILLKSEGTEFSKRAAAVSLNSSGIASAVEDEEVSFEGFFQANFVWIAGIIIVLALLLAVLLSGITGRKREDEMVPVSMAQTDDPNEPKDTNNPDIGTIS